MIQDLQAWTRPAFVGNALQAQTTPSAHCDSANRGQAFPRELLHLVLCRLWV